jgi:hypothetical protein
VEDRWLPQDGKLSEVDLNSLVGLLHEIRVNIGGVIAVILCFVVDDYNADDLILGRSWE